MPTPQLPDHVLVLHREVQRKFGRNLLRLQQYERLIKVIIAEHDIAGTSSDLNSNRAAKHDAVATKTLGQVVGALVGNFITPTSNSPSSSGNDEPPEDLTEPWVRVTHQIKFADDDFKRIQQRLADLVELRNELVHHFLEKHEILSVIWGQHRITFSALLTKKQFDAVLFDLLDRKKTSAGAFFISACGFLREFA